MKSPTGAGAHSIGALLARSQYCSTASEARLLLGSKSAAETHQLVVYWWSSGAKSGCLALLTRISSLRRGDQWKALVYAKETHCVLEICSQPSVAVGYHALLGNFF